MTTADDDIILAELDAFERGFVLGFLVMGGDQRPIVANALAGPARDRCAGALAAISAQPRGARVRLMGTLAREALAPLPAGIENVHPDTLRRALDRESDDTVRLIAANAPAAVQAAAATLLASRGVSRAGNARVPVPACTTDAAAELRRAVLSSIVAVPALPAGVVPDRWALRLLALTPDAIMVELRNAGAELLGASLGGSDADTIRRAAAHLEDPWSGRVLDAERATRESLSDSGMARRSRARAVVAATIPGDTPRDTLDRLGARELGDRLALTDPQLAVAVAQRLPSELGRLLLIACEQPTPAPSETRGF